jgi:hypothetical protein
MFQPYVEKAKLLHERYKRYLPATAFLGGFTWDSLTLNRIDNVLDIAIFGAYVLLSGVVIALIGRDAKFKFSEHLPWAVQFFFGGLFSSFVVYYFKSASSLPTLIFIVLLLTLLVGNEFMEKRYGRITLTATLYGIVTFMYLNSVLPILFKRMNIWTFLLAIALSAGIYYLLRRVSSVKRPNYYPIVGTYVILVVFYAFNVIPPVPLAKKDMAICRSVRKADNAYICSIRQPPWYSFWHKTEKNYAWSPGDTVFCFSSIFAPAELRDKVYHCWYRKDEGEGYQQIDRMGYSLIGGREEGYRGYTYKKNITPGDWKVVLRTGANKVLGVMTFSVSERDSSAPLALVEHRYD